MASHRMHRGLVTLSASAVAAIYFAGYLRTQAADAALEVSAAPPVEVATSIPARAASTSTPVVVTRAAATPRPSPTSAAVAATYKDGTFTGQGTSRRGDVWVSVLIQAGKISNVTITRSTLQYPLRDIANLPSEVVQRQSAQVDIVTRATYSSVAFRGAVSQALSSAKAA